MVFYLYPQKKGSKTEIICASFLIKEVWPCLYIHVQHKIDKKILMKNIHLLLLFSSSVVSSSVTPRTVAYQVSLSTEFSRQEHGSGLPCPPRKHIYIDISLESIMHVCVQLVCPWCRLGVRVWAWLSMAPSSSLLAWRPGRHAASGPGQSLAGAWLSSHMALILLFSGPAWDILHFPSLPLWEPLSPPLHLASGDAREGAVASRAWPGTHDPRRQL